MANIYSDQRLSGNAIFGSQQAVGEPPPVTGSGVFVKVAGVYVPATEVHAKVAGSYEPGTEFYFKSAESYQLL